MFRVPRIHQPGVPFTPAALMSWMSAGAWCQNLNQHPPGITLRATLFIRMAKRQKHRPDHGQARQSDTFAWLIAAVQVVGPILAVLILSVVLVYGIIHLVFLR